ncbi:MAG: GNAT family N-acetyltransferase [Thermoleophilaceae bacterium]
MPLPLPLPDPPLADSRVALRPWREEDLPALVAELQDPDIPRWTFIPFPYAERDGREFLAKQRHDLEAGTGLALAIEAVDGGALAGAIGIEPLDRVAGRGEIGYWVAREQRCRGIATRAVKLLSGWALGELGLERLAILPFAGNTASERVAERAGFSRERTLPAHRLHPLSGEVRDMTLFGITRGRPL